MVRAYCNQGYLAHHDFQEKIEQLQARIEHLEQQLDETQKRNSATTTVSDPAFLDQFLTHDYKPLEQLLKEIVESVALDDLLRKPVENQLYFLASQDKVEYERGHGWKRTDEQEEEEVTTDG